MENKTITISNEIPDIYKKCHEKFGVEWDRGVIITYGNTIYCKFELSQPKMVHEAIHVDQQNGFGIENWWELYFEDTKFRLDQEVEAYRAEVKFINKNIKDRNEKARMIHKICTDLSSSMYGSICTFSEAKNLIK